MSGFLFQGDFVRKPSQTLGGSSRGSENKDSLLLRAENERKRRERERQEQAALLKLQAFFRGCIERKCIRKEWQTEFDQQKKSTSMSDEQLFLQIYRLNLFFNEAKDIQRLLELGKVLLIKYPAVMNAMKSNNTMAFAVKRIIQKCFISLHSPNVPVAVFLRLIETYTDPTKYSNEPLESLSNDTVKLVGNIWLYLVGEMNIFEVYRRFLEKKLPPMRSETETNRITQSYDYLMVFKRVLSLKSQLKGRNIILSTKFETYDTDSAINLIISEFVITFSMNVIPLEGNNGIAAHFILPRLCHFFDWEDGFKIVLANINKYMKDDQGDGMRNIFYVILTLAKSMPLTDASIGGLLQAINEFLPSIDPSNGSNVLKHGLTRHLLELGMDMETEDEEDIEIPYSFNQSNAYLLECTTIYSVLSRVLNKSEIASWLCPFQLSKWKLVKEIISCIVRLEPTLSTFDLKFLSALSYRRDFMKSLCIYCITTPNLSPDDLVTFCWFFSHLSGTLHDAEFLSALPIQKEELSRLIVIFRDLCCDMVLRDTDSISTAGSALKAISATLMRLHDRNSRMHLFTEEIFISSTMSKIIPVETHLLKFEHIINDGPFSDLSPMEVKLLKILKEFPFALSFHDRVKVWNRLLDLDKQTNDPFPMSNRGVQVRRNYIYEDAFEKLSPENVPDLRRQIRISLVNVVGVMEAGIDGGGLLREFLTEATKAAVDPNRGLFRFDSQNRIYPNPVAKKLMSDFRKHYYVIGRLVGKSLYEQTLLELPIAAFFIQYCIEGKVLSAVDFLATLDPALHKNLLALKTFKGDINTLGLDFTVAVEELGETRVVELKQGGKDIAVDHNNVIEYIHLISDYKINKEMEDECRNFRAGMLDVVPTMRMFSWKELQTLISGSDKPIDTDDWRANTNYGQEFSDLHPTIIMFWQVVKIFDEKCLRMLLKFVTSCSRPPLLGFKDLVPKFGIQSAGKIDRLPTASTCMNLLKLPEFTDMNVMKEKLVYVINAHAGFELS